MPTVNAEKTKKTKTAKKLIVTVAETVFVIPAEAGIQFFFALDPCFGFPQGGVPRRGDTIGFCFPQQILYKFCVFIFEFLYVVLRLNSRITRLIS